MLNKSKNKVGRTGNKWVYALLMAFPVLHFCVFYVYVNANSIAMAFQNVDPVTGEITLTFANFADQFKFLTTGPALNMLRVSLLGYVIHLVVGLTTGLMFAYYVYKKRTMSSMFRVLMFLPSIIPAIVLVTIYRYFADNAFPEIIAGLFNLTETPQGLFSNNETRLAVIIFYDIFVSFGTSVLVYTNKMDSIEPSLIEAAKIDGATQFQEFWHIVLPMTFSTIGVFLVTGVASIFMNQMFLFSFYGWAPPADLDTFGYYFFRKTSEATTYNDKQSLCSLSALGLIFSAIAIPLTFGVRYLLHRYGPKED